LNFRVQRALKPSSKFISKNLSFFQFKTKWSEIKFNTPLSAMKTTTQRLYRYTYSTVQSSWLTATQDINLRQGHGPPLPTPMIAVGDRIIFGIQDFDFAQI